MGARDPFEDWDYPDPTGPAADTADNLVSDGYTDPLDLDPLLDYEPMAGDPLWAEDMSD